MHRYERGPVGRAEQGAALLVALPDSVVADAPFGVVLQVGPHAALEGWFRFAQRHAIPAEFVADDHVTGRHAQFPQTTTDHFQRQARAVLARRIQGDRRRAMPKHCAHGGELGFLRQRLVQIAQTTGAENDARNRHVGLTECFVTHPGLPQNLLARRTRTSDS